MAVKNCGADVQSEVANESFMRDMRTLLKVSTLASECEAVHFALSLSLFLNPSLRSSTQHSPTRSHCETRRSS